MSIGIAMFLVSRLVFANWSQVFFDSGEYLARWSNSSIIQALITGHPPLHAGYVALYWPVYQIISRFGLNPGSSIVVFQIISALTTVLLFGKIVARLTNSTVAKKSVVLISLVPIFWIANETVMMETTYLFFFFGSFYFLMRYFTNEEKDVRSLLLGSILWFMAFMTHTVVILWIPLLLYCGYIWNRGRIVGMLVAGGVTIVTASIANAWLLSVSMNVSFGQGIYWLYAAKFGEHAWFTLSLETIFRYLRNWIVPLIYNNSSPVVFIGLLTLIYLRAKSRKLFWLGVLWLAPSFVANQWWDSLFYGRHALISSFGLVFLTSVMVNKLGYKLLTGVILIISLWSLHYLTKPIPYLQIAQEAASLPSGGLLIESHFARPYVEGRYFGKIMFVDEPGWEIKETRKEIEAYLRNGRGVFVTGQALSEPYGLFSGPYLHPLSLSYKNSYILEDMIDEWGLKEHSVIDRERNLVIYEVGSESDEYANIVRLDRDQRRLDYLDPLRIFMNFLLDFLSKYV